MPTAILTSTGTWTAPSNVVSPVSVEIIGPGGGGGTAGASSGGGAGGGAYSKTNSITVVGNTVYNLTLPAGAAAAVDGTDAQWEDGSLCLAKGGKKGVEGTGGAGGLASGCVGDTKRNGGTGDAAVLFSDGGGGGGAAGSAAAGNNASAGTGGTAVTDGGAGANGPTNAVGVAGGSPGGGGSGGGGLGNAGGAGGNSWARITYTVDVAASISSVTGPASATYAAGTNIDLTVTFDENVTVTGAPYIALTIGGSTRNAAYLSGSGSTVLVFRYTTVAADYAPGGISAASPISLNGGTISDSLPQAATLTFTPPTLTGVLIVDTINGGLLNKMVRIGLARTRRL